MKKLLALGLFALFGAFLTLSATPPDKSWFTDAKAAMAEAKAKDIPVFALFTGSDWCPWCIKLDNDTLKTKEFQDYVKGKVVLLYLDFPRKMQLPEALAKQNAQWSEKYDVEGFPTIVILSPKGEELGRLSYAPVAEFIPQLNAILNPMKEADYKPFDGWMVNYTKALAAAKEKKQPVVVVFTGSDWANPALQLRKETLESAGFKDLTKNAVLLYVDFPRSTPIPPSIRKQNMELADKYDLEAVPATLVLNAEGKKLGEIVGLKPTAEYLELLGKILKE